MPRWIGDKSRSNSARHNSVFFVFRPRFQRSAWGKPALVYGAFAWQDSQREQHAPVAFKPVSSELQRKLGLGPDNANSRAVVGTLPIEQITVGMTVPALNPSISTSERDTFGATTAPRRLAKLDLLLASEGGSEIYLSLLRDPNTEFVKELLRDGGTEFGIEEIGAEGRVELLSYSEMTCQTASGGSLVTGTIRNSADYYYELVLSNGEQFRVTAKHPIWVETKKDFVSAEKLSLGDQVRLYADTFATVASLRRIDSPIDVFNIEVENEHVYYVGVDGMLVHNADGAKGYGGKGSDSAADAAKADEQAAVGTNTKRIKRRAESDDEYVDIYRGLNVEHPRFKDATDGIATPGNVDGHADAYRHGLGDTQDSRLTSWSTSEEVAMHYAKSADDRSCSGFGVVLHKRVKRSDLTAGSGPFVQADKEVLLEGVITDADVKWIFRE